MDRYSILASSAAIVALLTMTAVAQPSANVCDDDGGPEICVRFDNLAGAPQVNFDFAFDFDDPDNPGIEFRRGTSGNDIREWRVWSWDDVENQTPKNIGTLVGNNSWNFEMKILQPDGDPGADDLQEVKFGEEDIGDHWSKVEAGSITGDLPAGSTFKLHRYNSTGGYANFTVGGSVQQDSVIDLGRGEGFTIEGGVYGDVGHYVYLTFTEGIQGGNFTVGGFVRAAIVTVEDDGVITNGAFQVGDYADQMFMTVAEMGDNGHIYLSYTDDSEVITSGYIIIKSDLPASASIYAPDEHYTGTIKFLDEDPEPDVRYSIYGDLTFESFSGDIIAHDLAGTISVEDSYGHLGGGTGSLDLTGTMSGTLMVNTSQGNFSLSDVIINIAEDFTSEAGITIYRGSNGDFTEESQLNVGGDFAGTVFIGGDFVGDVTVGDDFTNAAEFAIGVAATPGNMMDGLVSGASFTVNGNFRGDFYLSGNVEDGTFFDLNRLGANGRIMIDGECDGDILIAKDTNATSLIQIIGGLTSHGLIVINEDEADSNDANGDIFIGNPLTCQNCELDIVYYDGVINVLNGTSGGGDLAGDVTVVGCHLDGNALELCVCGSETGSKTIVQTDCDPQVPGFTCSENPCN